MSSVEQKNAMKKFSEKWNQCLQLSRHGAVTEKHMNEEN